MANTKKIDLMRVNINLPIAVVNRVKEYADKLGINTTSAYIVLLNQALDQKEMTDNLPAMINIMKQLDNLKDLTISEDKLKSLNMSEDN